MADVADAADGAPHLPGSRLFNRAIDIRVSSRRQRSLLSLQWCFATMTAVAALMILQRPALAGPVGGSVVEGAAGISQAGAVTTINQSSNRAIINWQGFSVGKSETVNFNQPSAASATLNRVTGSDASVIAGSLNANGQVFLVNPNGVLFSKGSQVNVGGLVASTLDISNANFMAGRYVFEGSSSAAVVNQGRLHARDGGYISLLGKTVSNDGVIAARLGTVAMASGEKITLNFDGNSLLDVTIDKGTLNALVENKRAIKADGGTVILTAKAADQILSAQVNNSGVIQARTMASLKGGASSGVAKTGKIKLLADGGTVNVSGKLDASARKGGNAGTVNIAASGGAATLSGSVDASAATGTGGTIVVTGTDVTLTGTAVLDASGEAGGIILVGGDRHGGSDASENFVSTAVANATTTTIAAGATLVANGSNGNGGNVVVWSDGYTDFEGSISATGAGAIGNGGFAEVSSKGLLNFNGTADLSSASGAVGTLLLDPYNITISTGTDSNGGFDGSSPNNYNPTGTSVINTTTLQNLLNNADVVISTGGSGSAGTDAGNISITGALDWSSSAHSLTLTAANSISVASTGTMKWGTGTLTLNAGTTITNSSTAAWSWAGGALVLNAGGTAGTTAITAGKLSQTGSGSLLITATAGNIVMGATSLGAATTALVQSLSGSIAINGGASAGLSWSGGALTLDAATSISSANGTKLTQTGSGSLTATARGGTISLQGAVALDNATATLTSYGTDANASNPAINFYQTVTSTGSLKLDAKYGSISTISAGSLGGTGGVGVLELDAATGISILANVGSGSLTAITAAGDITLLGLTWSGSSGPSLTASTGSIILPVNASITATGTGTLTLTAATGITLGAIYTPTGATYGGTRGSVSLGGASLTATTSTGTIEINEPLTWSGGNVDLEAGSVATDGSIIPGSIVTAATASLTQKDPGAGAAGSLVLKATTGITLGALYDIKGNAYVGNLGSANLGGASLTANTKTGAILLNQPLTWSGSSVQLSATAGAISTAAMTQTGNGGGLALSAGTDITLGGDVALGNATASLTAGRDITINGALGWSNQTLILGATDNIYVRGDLTGTGSTVGLTATFGTGLNADGTAMGLVFGISSLGAYDKISLPDTAAVSLNSVPYTVITSQPAFDTASGNASGHYVLGADIDNISLTEISANQFGSSFNGFGHSLTLQSAGLTASSISSLRGLNQTNIILPLTGTLDIASIAGTNGGSGMMTIQTTGDINITGQLALTSESLVLSAGGNLNINAAISVSGGVLVLSAPSGFVNVNADVTATNNASLAFAYNAATDPTTNLPLGGLNLAYSAGTSTFAEQISFLNETLATPLTINGSAYTLIKSWDDLKGMSATGNYALATDLTVNTAAQSAAYVTSFTGILNGLGHVIDGLNAPLIGTLGSSTSQTATVTNLGLSNVSITLGNGVQGTLVNTSWGTLANDFTTGTLTAVADVTSGGSNSVGGLAGISNGVIRNSYADVTVTGITNVGGLVGTMGAAAQIIGSYATGTVTGSGNNVGGLAGAGAGKIINSYTTGNVSGASNVGGLVGSFGTGQITNAYATGNVLGSGSNVGGLVGSASSVTLSNSFYQPGATSLDAGIAYNVKGASSVGGLAGSLTGDVTNSHATGTIVATGTGVVDAFGYPMDGSAGGLFGGVSGTVSNSQAINVTVFGVLDVGGLAGVSAATISDSTASGTVTGAFADVGGLIGSNSGALTKVTANVTVKSNGDNTRTVTGTIGYTGTGGLVGSNSGTINNATATGTVTAVGMNVGGLVGHDRGGSIYNSSATGNVTGGSDNIGGLVGLIVTAGNVEIVNSSASGAVTGANHVGGLVGSSIVENANYDLVNFMSIAGSSASGNVTSSGNYSGGLLGSSQGTVLIVGSNATGDVVSRGDYAGALIGAIQQGNGSGIFSSIGSGTVSGDQTQTHVGGLIGSNDGATVDSYSSAPNSVNTNPGGGDTGGGGGGGGTTPTNDDNDTIGSPSLVLDHVIIGDAVVVTSGSTTTISTSDKAIIDWTRFSVASTETLIFSQPAATSVVLNRVTGNERTIIAGTLSANGGVFIVNPAGVLFSAGSQVNVGALVATTLAINDSDFLASNYVFQASSSNNSIINKGNIVIADGGFVALASQKGVTNNGLLVVPDGKAILASTSSLTLNVDAATGSLSSDVVDTATLSGTINLGGTLSISGSGVLEVAGANVNITTPFEVATLNATAANNVNVNAAQSWTNNGSWTISAANVNINAPVSWSAGTLTLNAGVAGGFINVNAVMTASNTANLVMTYNTASTTNFVPLGGINMAFATDPTTGLGNGSFAGKLEFSGTGSLTLGGQNDSISYDAAHRITTWSELMAIAGSGNYVLLSDLTAAAATTPSTAYIATFTGTLNGLGHTVSGLGAALFGTLGNTNRTAMVSNLGLPNANINQGNVEQGSGIQGTLADINYGKLVNVFATGTLIAAPSSPGGAGDAVGGLVGVNDYLIIGSYADVNVSGKTNVGGLVGSQYLNGHTNGQGEIANSYAMGNVIGTAANVGGLVGQSTATVAATAIYNSFYRPGATSLDASGVAYNVEGANSVGGLVGNLGGTVAGSQASGTIIATAAPDGQGNRHGDVGGLVGTGGSISNSQAINVTVVGIGNVGGLAGSSGDIINSSATGTATGSGNVGGLVGSATGTLANDTAYVTVTSTGGDSLTSSGADNAGGLAGTCSCIIINSHAYGSVYSIGNNAGGLVGNLTGGSVYGSSASGNVTGTADNVGGLVGNVTSTTNTVIVGSTASGSVSGHSNVGGLVGNASGGNTLSILGSTASGNVFGSGDNVGGLLGNGQGTTIIGGSTATGNVTGLGNNVGALAGRIEAGLGSAIYASNAFGSVSGPGSNVGGLIGRNDGALVDNNSTYTDVAAQKAAADAAAAQAAAAAAAAQAATARAAAQRTATVQAALHAGAASAAAAAAAADAASQAGMAGAGLSRGASADSKVGDNFKGIEDNVKADDVRLRRRLAAEVKRRSSASRRGGNLGVIIRSIEIDGQRFNLEDGAPKPDTSAQPPH
jgi:filamentous hemagglutinin family protein